MRELNYPFDSELLLKRKKQIKKELLASDRSYICKKIAILGGQTTQDIKLIMELFLLNNGIKVEFYESEYNQYYESGMFSNLELEEFKPDLIYVCTCNKNILEYPCMTDDEKDIEKKINDVCVKFYGLWDKLRDTYHCPIIQNNFEYPFFRLMGNKDASDIHGRVNFITRLNCYFYNYAGEHDNFYICDINYISATYGLEKWSDPYYWHMYKYAVAVPAIPYLAFNVANIIKSIYGRNKKVLNLDLDNTLWGGIIGDDGVENIEIGQETALAQTYSEFQEYIKLHKQLGVLLTVNSKNDENNALSGFERPDSILKREDFALFKANWDSKSVNLAETAKELNLLPESFVFIDDNPSERAIVEGEFPYTAVPPMDNVEKYIQMIDKSAFFELTSFTADDIKRDQMYKDNLKRQQSLSVFTDYNDYLKSLEMKGEIQSFIPLYMSRIAQLTNKSNQFNLTTKRYSQNDIEDIANDDSHITLYGKMEDKFGDNGVVSIVIGKIGGAYNDELHMELWLMSCRVLKREMEFAMMDELVYKAKSRGIKKIFGYYYPTAKNSMVKDFYAIQGFGKVKEDEDGNTVWELDISGDYQVKQNVIQIKR